MDANRTYDKAVFGVFLVLVASLAVQKPAVTYLFGKSVSVTDIIFPFVLVLALGYILLSYRRPTWNKVFVFFAAYIGAFILASVFSSDPKTSFAKTFATAYLIGLATLAIILIDSEKRLRRTIIAWLAGATIPVAIGIFTIFLYYISPSNELLPSLTYQYGAVPVGNFPRLSSTFVSASMFCNYLTATALLVLAARGFARVPAILWWVLFAGIVICSVFTVSAGFGAFIFGIAIWYCFYRRCDRVGRLAQYAGIILCVISVLATVVAFQPHSTAPYSIPFFGVELYPSSRLLVWSQAIEIFLNNFFTGNGPGMPSASVIFQNTDGHFSGLTDAHNSFLSLATQTGIVGLIVFTATCADCLKVGFAQPRSLNIRLTLAVAFLAAFVLQGLTGAFEDARHMWILIGMLIASGKVEGNGEEISAEV